MPLDQRTRLYRDVRALSADEVFDERIPAALARNAGLAGRGARYKALAPLALDVDGRSITLTERGGDLLSEPGSAGAQVVAQLAPDALSDLVQDRVSTMGLMMAARVKITRGDLGAWIAWEPALRALLDARPVYENGSVGFRDRSGGPLDLNRAFRLGDDPTEVSHFLHEAGFLHIAGVFDESEMAAVAADLDVALEGARPDDGESWWAGDADGVDHPVRILWFHEKSEALAALLRDERTQAIPRLSGDDHNGARFPAEGLIKPLNIVRGLSDLPWHKDCGPGGHSYNCSSLTVGISVTGAGPRNGALGVIPGSHRANVQSSLLDPTLDLAPLMLETRTGDVTVHCSDTLHMSHAPLDHPRKVVYTAFALRPRPGDVLPETTRAQQRAERARLTSVRDRIDAAAG